MALLNTFIRVGCVALCSSLLHASYIENDNLKQSAAARVGNHPQKFVVDLDKKPQERWSGFADNPLFRNYKQDVEGYVSQFVPKSLLPVVATVAKSLKHKYYSEYADEMVGMAKALGVSVGDIVLVNLIYQLEDVGVSCEKRNTTGPCPPKQSGPGLCTGVVVNGNNAKSGEIWQGRNLDWNLDAKLLRYALQVDYQRNNKTVFTGFQIAGQVGVLHGLRREGFSVQMNARDCGGNILENLLEQILLGGKCPSHVLRYAFENMGDFASAEKFLSTERLANPVYYIMAGRSRGDGAILTRGRSELVDAWHLFENPAKDKAQLNIQPEWFRLQTNYDHWQAAPSYDNRRDPGVAHVNEYCSASVDESSLMKVMQAWPTKNHHTDVTSVMCPYTGYFETLIWTDPVLTIAV